MKRGGCGGVMGGAAADAGIPGTTSALVGRQAPLEQRGKGAERRLERATVPSPVIRVSLRAFTRL